MKFDRAELTLYNLIRSTSNDKEWIDAYNTQISRMLNKVSINYLSSKETKILYFLLTNCVNSYLNYISKKHC